MKQIIEFPGKLQNPQSKQSLDSELYSFLRTESYLGIMDSKSVKVSNLLNTVNISLKCSLCLERF